jgi:hypothetical protein
MRESEVQIGNSGLEIFSVSLEDCHGASSHRSDDHARGEDGLTISVEESFCGYPARTP